MKLSSISYITIYKIKRVSYLVEVVGCVQKQHEGLGEKQTFLQNSKNNKRGNISEQNRNSINTQIMENGTALVKT